MKKIFGKLVLGALLAGTVFGLWAHDPNHQLRCGFYPTPLGVAVPLCCTVDTDGNFLDCVDASDLFGIEF